MKKIAIMALALGIMGVACHQKEKNPFFTEWNTPYQIPPFDKIKNEHYIPAFEKAMEIQNEELQKIANSTEAPTFKNTIEAMEYSGDMLNKVSLVFFNLTASNNSDTLMEINEKMTPKLSKHSDDIYLNVKLFSRIKTLYDQKENLGLTSVQKRLLEETYKDFVANGANVPADKQDRFRKVNEEIASYTLKYGNNVLKATNDYQLIIDKKEDLSGLPQGLIDAAAETANAQEATKGKWVFTLHNPSLIPFLTYADNRVLREKIWRAYSERCASGEFDNSELIDKIVNLRMERAHLLGYESHAAYILSRNMAETPQNVYDLLNKIWTPALAKAKEEAAEYQKMIDKSNEKFKLQPWDWRYYAEKVRKEKYDLDEEMIKPYFKLENVRDGIFTVSEKLYGLTFKENKALPTYDSEAVPYEVIDNGKVIGIIYMDFYPRATKASGAWMTNFREQHYTQDGKNVIPIVSIVCNFTKPTADKPSLLTFDEAETFFHEFGHGLHGLLSNCQYPTLAGTNVARDFVELPSQIMENWCSHPDILKLYAKHYQTQEVIPQGLIDKITASGTYGQGFITTELLAASLLDMAYHTIIVSTPIKQAEFEKAEMNKIGLISEIIPRYKSPYFKHIFADPIGYSCGYYAYTWAEVLDADAFEAFVEKGVLDKETATSFRKNILEKGNTEDPMVLYERFRGKKPSVEPLLNRRGLN